MTAEPASVETSRSSDNWLKTLFQPVILSYQKNSCNMVAYELGLEISLGTYFISYFGLKKKQSAFKHAMVAFFVVPLVTWPLCVIQKENEKQSSKGQQPREL